MKRERQRPIRGLQELLDRLSETAKESDQITIADMLAAAGRRSFGPLLLVPGIVVLSPLSGIPGLPTTVAVIVLLIAVQFLFRHNHFWLPKWVLCRKATSDKLQRAIRFLRPVARFMDWATRERLRAFTGGVAIYPIALLCVLIAVTMPPLEIVPFANSLAGAALTSFGLALITQDGVLALLATAFCAVGFWLVLSRVLEMG